MITYVPKGFGDTSSIGPHQGLRITFAVTPTPGVPTTVESAELADKINYLVSALNGGGIPLAPASGVNPAPGDTAYTIDFLSMGNQSVADALDAIQGAMYGPLDFLRRVYIRRVELMGDGGTPWGSPVDVSTNAPDTGLSLADLLQKAEGLALVIGGAALLVAFLPEIKAGIRKAQSRA